MSEIKFKQNPDGSYQAIITKDGSELDPDIKFLRHPDGSYVGIKVESISPGISTFLELRDTPASYTGQGNKVVVVLPNETGLTFSNVAGSGATTFLELTDTPDSYTGYANKIVAVNSLETGLTFTNLSTSVSTFLDLSDTPNSYTGQANKYVRVLPDETGLTFNDVSSITTFLGLSDTPDSYVGQANKGLVVLPNETGLGYTNFLLASIYDQNNNGIVDRAEALWNYTYNDFMFRTSWLNIENTYASPCFLDGFTFRTFVVKLTGNTTFYINNPITGMNYKFILHQDSVGNHSINFGNTVKWRNGITPSFSTMPLSVDIAVLLCGGLTFYGEWATNYT